MKSEGVKAYPGDAERVAYVIDRLSRAVRDDGTVEVTIGGIDRGAVLNALIEWQEMKGEGNG